MVTVPINFTGGDFQHKSRPLSKQWTRNFWPQQIPNEKARSNYVLQSFYGLKIWKEFVGGKFRGQLKSKGILYRVVGTNLYKVDRFGAHTSLGYVGGSNRCILSPMGDQIIVANGSGVVYVWDGASVIQNTSPNLGNPRGVTVLNNQAVYDDGVGQGFVVSDVGKPSVIAGLNNANAESNPDDLLIPYAYSETLYLFGTETIELWWNSGSGNPPVDRIQGASINMGLDAIYSLAETPDFLVFFGADKQFHTLTGGTTSVDTVISTPAMAKEFQKYAVTSDCIGYTMQLEGQWFYVGTFPTQGVTWICPIGGEWFQWGQGNEGRHRSDGYSYVYDKHLVSDYLTGNIYELDAETYTDDGETIIRTRDTAPIHGGLFKADGKDFEINRITFFLEKGVGNIDGQGKNPLLMVSLSKDGGKTFGTERMLKCGELNNTRITVSSNSWGRIKGGSECVLRVRVSDPVYWVIFGGELEVEVCI